MICHFPAPSRSWGTRFLLFFGRLTIILFFCTGASASDVVASSSNNITDDSLAQSDIDWSAFADASMVSPDLDDDTTLDTYETNIHGLPLSPVDDGTAAGESIDVSELNSRNTTVSEVLGPGVGIQVRSAGGPGSYTTAHIRGSDAAQVLIFIDGILLNSGGFSTVNLSDLTLEMFDRVDVYRGTTPVSLGLGSIGGAISLNTGNGSNETTEYSAGYGSWHSGKATALHRSTTGRVDVFALVSVMGSRGDFKYLNRNGTELNTTDDEIVRRKNNEQQSVSTLLKLSTYVGKMRLTFLNSLHMKNQGVAGIDSVPVEKASLFCLRELAAVQGEREWNKQQSLMWSLGYIQQQNRFEDPLDEIGVGHQHSHAIAHTVLGHSIWHFGTRKYQFATRVEGSLDTFDFVDAQDLLPLKPGYRQRLGGGIDFSWIPQNGLKIVPSLRSQADRYTAELPPAMGEQKVRTIELSDQHIMPSLGISWQLTRRHRFLSNVGKYLRTPDLFELFGDRGTVVGNPELKAEEGLNADAGIKYTFEANTDTAVNTAQIYAGTFGTWSEQLIAFVQNSQNTIRAENVHAARILGLEISAEATLWSHLSLSGNYTYMQTVNRSEIGFYAGNRLPGRPIHEAYLKSTLKGTIGSVRNELWLDVDYAGNNFLDQANFTQDVLGRALLGAGWQLEIIPAKLTVTLEIKNLLNSILLKDSTGRQRPLRDYLAFPLPGRSVFVTLRFKV
ncbi:MAG: TonB-dependent receptor [Deltaproteobacteria bacterium]|nr:TonB-dependent receptor [Deltaproteobacteria bacterium]